MKLLCSNLSLGGLYTDANANDNDTNTDDDNNNNDTWQTEHDCIGSLQNVPKKNYMLITGFLMIFILIIPKIPVLTRKNLARCPVTKGLKRGFIVSERNLAFKNFTSWLKWPWQWPWLLRLLQKSQVEPN